MHSVGHDTVSTCSPSDIYHDAVWVLCLAPASRIALVLALRLDDALGWLQIILSQLVIGTCSNCHSG